MARVFAQISLIFFEHINIHAQKAKLGKAEDR